MTVKTIGPDMAKDVFQVHGISENGRVIFSKAIKRAKPLTFFETLLPYTVSMEACGSAHHWGRELRKIGHEVKLMPAFYVKPYVKRGKTDAVDAEAICEAVRRPSMRFVAIKTEDQQAILSIHRTRDLVVRQRTQVANLVRRLLREFGHVLPTGIEAVTAFAKRHLEGDRLDMPGLASGVLGTQCYHFLGLNERIDGYPKMIEQHDLLSANARRLMRIPGVGPITASAIVAMIGEARQFGIDRDFAAWLGLTPLNKSSGGKDKLGRITKKGDRYIRKLLVVGMSSRALLAKKHPERVDMWTANIIAEKPFRLATTAMANKAARIIWAMLKMRQEYLQPAV
jgi:transposase